MENNLTIIKLGGSLLTDKTKPYTMNLSVVKNIAAEIRTCLDNGLINNLALVHGVGSFGHPPVIKHKLYKGLINEKQLLELSITQSKVNEFRLKTVGLFQKQGIALNLLHASSVFTGEGMDIRDYYFNAIKGFLKIGMIPFIGGDMMYDDKKGFSVLSGDEIAVRLTRELNADKLVFATDVHGVYTQDPKHNKNVSLVKEININESKNDSYFSNPCNNDASGLMQGKLESISKLKDLISSGLEVVVLSMKHRGVLKNFLQNKKAKFTRIVNN